MLLHVYWTTRDRCTISKATKQQTALSSLLPTLARIHLIFLSSLRKLTRMVQKRPQVYTKASFVKKYDVCIGTDDPQNSYHQITGQLAFQKGGRHGHHNIPTRSIQTGTTRYSPQSDGAQLSRTDKASDVQLSVSAIILLITECLCSWPRLLLQ